MIKGNIYRYFLNMAVAFACIRTSIMYKCSKFGIVLNLLEIANNNNNILKLSASDTKHKMIENKKAFL